MANEQISFLSISVYFQVFHVLSITVRTEFMLRQLKTPTEV